MILVLNISLYFFKDYTNFKKLKSIIEKIIIIMLTIEVAMPMCDIYFMTKYVYQHQP